MAANSSAVPSSPAAATAASKGQRKAADMGVLVKASSSTETKASEGTPLELDLASFLQSHGGNLFSSSSSDEDDEDPLFSSVRCRTVDEILNESDSSSSSHPSSVTPPVLAETLTLASDLGSVNREEEESPVAIEDEQRPVQEMDGGAAEEPSSSFGWRRRSRDISIERRHSRDVALSSSPLLPSRSLPPLFGSIRQNAFKPGDALAAAEAASRTVLMPHATAIKNRRTGSGVKVLEELVGDGKESAVSEGLESETGVVLAAEDQIDEDSRNVIKVPLSAEEMENTGGLDLTQTSQNVPISTSGDDDSQNKDVFSVVAENSTSIDETMVATTEEVDLEVLQEETEASQEASDDLDEKSSPSLDIGSTKEENENDTDIDKLVKETLAQLEKDQKAEENADENLRSSMKPLEWAEELEKRNASSGLHWEEGVAAQPMRLEGIRRGPPAVGYLQIDIDNEITRAISSQPIRHEYGSPQVVAVHMSYIALGMSKGAIFVFPSRYSAQSADTIGSKTLIPGPNGEKAQLSVSSICFNQQGNLLLIGYANGHAALCDVLKGTIAKVITTEHTAPVIHAFFLGQDLETSRQFKVVTGDCKGLVLLHAISSVMLVNLYTVSTQCIFDGKKTATVLSACPLLRLDLPGFAYTPAQGNLTASPNGLGSMVGGVVGAVGKEAGWKLFNDGSSLAEEGVVVFVTHQNALVVKLSPTVEVFVKLSRPDEVSEGAVPYTAWRWAANSRGSSHDLSHRVSWLAIAWDRKIQVFELAKTKLKIYKEWYVGSSTIGLAWLDDQMLVVVTLKGELCLFSKDGNEFHRTSFLIGGLRMDDIMVYNTYFSNAYGNPEKAYHNSVAVRGATVYLLGPMHLMVSRLLPWKERIHDLQRAGDWMGALDMSMRLYDGHAHGVIDLPADVNAIREVIMPFLVELVLSYVDESFSYISISFCNKNGKAELTESQESNDSTLHTEREEQYARVGGVAVEFCVHIKRTDILFDSIFSRFVVVQQGGTFLEILEPYILKDMLGSLPPEIMQALVEHYNSKGWLQRVEQCVLHMDISSLDFNQVVRLCREHGLYGALIYLFNQGLDDFRTPLEELLVVVQDTSRTDAASIGYRMLVYLKYCFKGLAFPPGHGTLSDSRLHSVRTELVQFLLEDSKAIYSQVLKDFKASSGTCPNICHLLLLDTEATLEVIGCAFSESIKDSEKEDNLEILENKKVLVQRTIDMLIGILDLESEVIQSFMMEDGVRAWPSEKDLDHLLVFIAFFVSCEEATISGRVLKHILEYMTSKNVVQSDLNQSGEVFQKEKLVLILLKTVPQKDWSSDDVLHLCMKAQFHQACGLIQAIRHQYAAALDSYIKDMDDPVHTFVYINKIMSELKDNEASLFQSEVIQRIPELVKLSRDCTFSLAIDRFANRSQHILSLLRKHPKSLFLFLQSAIDVHVYGNLNFPALEIDQVVETPFGKIKRKASEVEAYAERSSNFPKTLQNESINITEALTEEYLALLCQFEPCSVLRFLETFDGYRLENCLRLCLEHGVTDAAAYLLERVGDVSAALALVMKGLEEKIDFLVSAIRKAYFEEASSNSTEIEFHEEILRMNEVISVWDALHASIGLCQRNTQRLDPKETEALWFQLLDAYSEPLKRSFGSKDQFEIQSHDKLSVNPIEQVGEEYLIEWKSSPCSTILTKLFSQFIGEIIEGMVGYVNIPVIMAKLLSDNGNQEFGDFRSTIQRILGTYGYERRILDTAKSLIEDDTYYTLSLLKKGASHAYAPQGLVCCICGCSLANSSSASQIRVFSCGHWTHLHCESAELKKDASVGCPICLTKNNVQARNKSLLIVNGLVEKSSIRTQSSEGIRNVQHLHEPDNGEKLYGQQTSRFEVLRRLQKSQKLQQIDALPQLKLSPPAVYHEKIQQRKTSLLGEPSDASLKSEKTNKWGQLRDLKQRTLRFPLKSTFLGTEKNKVR